MTRTKETIRKMTMIQKTIIMEAAVQAPSTSILEKQTRTSSLPHPNSKAA
jgi:hypothetical protein